VVGDSARRGVNRIVGSLVQPVVNAVDMDEVLEHVDVDAVLERVDLNDVLDRVDIDRLLARIDVNGLIDRVDLDAVMARVDVDALLQRIDVDGIISRVDVARVVADANIGNVMTDSATSVLDFGRAQLNGLDAMTASLGRRAIRKHDERPGATTTAQPISHTPASAFTRLAAYVIDIAMISLLFGLSVFLITYLANLFFSKDFDPTQNHGPWWAALSVVFAGFYFWIGLALVGRTIGKALLGLRVVALDGSQVGAGHALIRVLVFPFSFILGLGFLPIVFGRDRRALHDGAAKTIEVYDWGDRVAVLPARFTRWFTPHAPVG
jgi:uncharacterized RDD family membrane protein YckC